VTRRSATWLLAAALLGAAAVAFVLLGGDATPTDGPTAAPSAQVSPEAVPSPTTTASPSPSETPTETLAEQVVRVAGVVADIRGLVFDATPEPVVLDDDGLEARVREQVEEYEPDVAELDGRLLAALGVLEPGTDVRQLIIDAYGEQVAGFYDPETEELVVGAESGTERLGRVDELTLAHELQHALADQVFGLPDEEDVPDGLEDDSLARQALIEGDATVTMSVYVQVGFTQADRLALLGELGDLQTSTVDATELPYLLQRSLEFPYVEGASFVGALVEAEGWSAVDDAYDDPPTSTAAILEPRRYLDGVEPDAPASRGQLGAPWQLARTIDLGAADLLYLFEAPGDDTGRALPESRDKALAWAGGTVDQWQDGGRDAFAVALTGDVATLCGAVDDWYAAAFPEADRSEDGRVVAFGGDRQHATLRCDDVVRLGIGPDADTATAASSPGG
jgi:hypothetical protein